MQAEAGTFVEAQRQEALELRAAHHERVASICADEAATLAYVFERVAGG